MAQYGTLSVLDTLAQQRNTTVANYGEDRTFESIQIALAAHDQIMADMVMDLVEFTDDQLRSTGGDATFDAEELDEFGRPAPQKTEAGQDLGFPLRRYGNALQWTRDWLRIHTPPEMVAQVNAIQNADRRNIIRALKRAIHTPTNSSFKDVFTNNITLPVKALANGDGFALPPGPDGQSFDADTHTHYLARAGGALAAADLSGLIATVREHYAQGEIVVDINQAQETDVRALTGFTAYVDARLVNQTAGIVAQGTLDTANIYDRAIGIFDGAEVRVKPWTVENYLVAHIRDNAPVLAMRTRTGQAAGALELVSDIDIYPLRANMWRREFGVSVANRVGAAVLYVGDTTYAAPSL